MERNDASLNGRALLAVFAHPDDESLACGGLLARCADAGARITLVCATRGERGPRREVTPEDATPLPDLRAVELAGAARTLGIAEVVLLDHKDGFLPWTEQSQLEGEIREVIARIHPDVVVTFGHDGLYWHPDHIAIHERTTAAVASFGEDAPALYYVTMPPGRMRGILESRQYAGELPNPGPFGITDPDAFGVLAEPPTLIVDVSGVAARKLAALRCHSSQLLVDGPITSMSEADAVRLLGTEHFHRARVGSGAESFIERFATPLDSDEGTPFDSAQGKPPIAEAT